MKVSHGDIMLKPTIVPSASKGWLNLPSAPTLPVIKEEEVEEEPMETAQKQQQPEQLQSKKITRHKRSGSPLFSPQKHCKQ